MHKKVKTAAQHEQNSCLLLLRAPQVHFALAIRMCKITLYFFLEHPERIWIHMALYRRMVAIGPSGTDRWSACLLVRAHVAHRL
jgi:hypothetical protein